MSVRIAGPPASTRAVGAHDGRYDRTAAGVKDFDRLTELAADAGYVARVRALANLISRVRRQTSDVASHAFSRRGGVL